jgi:hypothetical protein
MTTPDNTAWRGSLVAAIKTKITPVRVYMDGRYPNRAPLQQRGRGAFGAIVVDRVDGANFGTLGGAFDWLVRFLLHPSPAGQLAVIGPAMIPPPADRKKRQPLFDAMVELALKLGANMDRPAGEGTFTGPVDGSTLDPEVLARGCWALALGTELYRVGPFVNSPLLEVNLDGDRQAALMALAPAAGLAQLRDLRDLAGRALMPKLRQRSGLWALGPTFAGSALINADADLIAGGLLVDIKTDLGELTKTGRVFRLELDTIYQLAGYALLDFDDEFGIDTVGLYAARYGNLVTWPLDEYLAVLAGRPVSLPEERAAFREMLVQHSPRAREDEE